MKNILEQLYNGELCPAEQYSHKNEEYRKRRQENYSHYKEFIQLLGTLDPPLDNRFIAIMDEQLNLIPYECSATFIDGFRLGARIMAEIFIDG